MNRPILRVTKENGTGRNIEFQDTRNNRLMSDVDLISRLKTGRSSYNQFYTVKHDKNGREYVTSRPDGNKINNLG